MNSPMQLSLALLAVAGVSSAANIRGFTSSNCSGNAAACTNINAGTCCNFPGAAINTISWDLPSNSRGFGFIGSANCPAARQDSTIVRGATTGFCQSYLTSLGSAKWLTGSQKLKSRTDDKCQNVDSYLVFHDDGTEEWKKIPEGKVDEVLDLVAKGDNEALKQIQ